MTDSNSKSSLPSIFAADTFLHIAIGANQVEILSKFQNVLAMKVDYQENRFLRQNILTFRVTSTTYQATNMY